MVPVFLLLAPSWPHLGVCCSSEAAYTATSEGGGCVQLLHSPGLCLPARVGEQVEYPRLCMEALNRQNVVQPLREEGGGGGGREGRREKGRKRRRERRRERNRERIQKGKLVISRFCPEYFGCAHISTWLCVLRFHTRMVASRDPLRMVGPQG